ncbi:MAG: sulfatase-like hydrolase/transferase, partial [Vicinamibacteria bacterium]
GQIQSPTFGGGSWRAHATFLSGFHADSEHLYDALLASKRRTLVHVLREKGYRTVAAEPGIKWYWPEGLFYGFDRIYDFEALDYRGPPIGWWKIPDQFTLYRIYQDEIRTAETPLFVKFSLIMTHIPYYPVPQYVPRWSRFDDGTAYDAELQSVAHDAYRDLMELSTWYIEAVGYEVDVLEGFLLDYVPENSLVIIVGDHQPPKLATHDNDSWAVPMHVLSRREDLVRAFDALGLEKGLVPRSPNALRMADFLPRFLEIFDGVRTD